MNKSYNKSSWRQSRYFIHDDVD